MIRSRADAVSVGTRGKSAGIHLPRKIGQDEEKKLKRKSAQEGNFQQGSARHLGSQALQQQQADDEIFYRHSPPAPGNQQQAKRPRSMNVGSEGTGVGSTSRTNPVAQAPPRPGDPVTSAGASASRPQQHQPQPGNLLPGDDVSSSSSILAMYAPALSTYVEVLLPQPRHCTSDGQGELLLLHLRYLTKLKNLHLDQSVEWLPTKLRLAW